MKETICKKRDAALRRKAFELYARALACREEGVQMERELKSYLFQAEELLEELELPCAEDERLKGKIKELGL